MNWALLWWGLVLATIAGAVLLALRLWRAGRRLFSAMGEAAAVTGQLADQINRIADEQVVTPPLHPLAVDREHWDTELARLRKQREARKAARRARHEQTRHGWRSYWR